MDFSISDELAMIKETAARFTAEELRPLDTILLQRELRMWTDGIRLLPEEDHKRLMNVSRDIGFWGIDVDPKLGGQGLGMLAKTLVVEEMSKSLTGFSHHAFTLPPDAPNLHYLNEYCTEPQRQKYLVPFCKGELDSAMAVTEPGAGSDVSGVKTTAMRRNGKWVINGGKQFISKCDREDVFFILIAVSDKDAPVKQRLTAFLIDKATPGLTVGRVSPVIGAMPTWSLHLDGVEVGEEAVLGSVGEAFIPLQNRFGIRRIELAAHCTGMADALIKKMIDHANVRMTFGEILAERQTVQNWIADSTIELQGVRLMLYHAAWKSDQGHKDLRMEAASLKIAATEMLSRVVDRAIQLHGGMGLARETGIEYVARMVRIWRVLEGPSEIHRISLAKKLLKNEKPYELLQ
jgi:(R)-benzylsuccinyl-CoA dehydrogenase